MTTATSLVLIAVGAILAFAVSFSLAGLNIQTVGAILIIVGALGLAISVATLAGYAPWGSRASTLAATPPPAPAAPTLPATPSPPASV